MILGRPPGPRTGPYVALDRVADDDIGIGFQYVAGLEPKSQNHHVHFDISAEDISAAVSLVRAPPGQGFLPRWFRCVFLPRCWKRSASVQMTRIGLCRTGSAGLSKRS